MSMTNEALQRHLQDPAIFCCRRQKGLVISAADLEDPSLFDDMVEAGLLTLSEDGLRVEQVLGCTLMQDVEALTPITREVLDRVNEPEGQAEAAPAPAENPAASAEAFAPVIRTTVGGNGMIHIEIGKAEKLENLVMDIPVFGGAAPAPAAPVPAPEAAPEAAPAGEKKVIRTLVKKHIRITGAQIGDETSIRDGKITIDRRIVERAVKEDPLCKSLALDVIYPDQRHVYTETIMDVCPIAT
ncbi:MAG: D-proline reductase (dithiol) proprotein PrdA, partial [Aristaeellaceae bacterium]